MGEAYRHHGQYEQAIAEYTNALSVNPEFAEAYTFRGFAHFKRGRSDLAVEDFTEAIALKPYEFRSADQKKWLSMSINRFAFSTIEYQGYRGFAKEALKYVSKFVKQFHLSTISRTGLRYINAILFTREDGLLPLDRYFNLTIGLPSGLPSSVSVLDLRLDVPIDTGSLTIRLEPVLSPDGTREAFVLDFDYSKTKDLTPNHLRKYIDESHNYTKRFFEAIITDEFRQVMRGEVIE